MNTKIYQRKIIDYVYIPRKENQLILDLGSKKSVLDMFATLVYELFEYAKIR